MPKNALYAQSGGVTAVINASASAIVATARSYPEKIAKVYAARNGIVGALHDDLIDLEILSDNDLARLAYTPGGAFGSCRYKLQDLDSNRAEYEKLISVFKKHDIGYFFYNGGGDSQDTSNKIAEFSRGLGYPLTCIGVPKTIDNDLPFTDSSPGFGSVAKYVATSILEAGLDVQSMAKTSTKVFILEVMGRHAGWIAASSALGGAHVILLPEIAFDEAAFCAKVQQCVEEFGFCTVVVSEGLRNSAGEFVATANLQDAFGHKQLGGVAPVIASVVSENLKLKNHWAVADYLQRSAGHIASKVDVTQAYALGEAAVKFAVQGKNAIMPIVERISNSPYKWQVSSVNLSEVANQEKFMPRNFISSDGFNITAECKEYLLPLIQGEAYPQFFEGIPDYFRLYN